MVCEVTPPPSSPPPEDWKLSELGVATSLVVGATALAVKLIPVRLVLLIVSDWVAGENENPVSVGVTV
jgi:hypothetical protein